MKFKALMFLFSIALLMVSCTSTLKSTKPNEKKKSEEDQTPFLTRPKIRSYVVPDTIEGNKYIRSHRVFILDDAGNWSKD